VGLLGPNGAGKTTLLKIISTLIYPTSGTVTLSGIDVRRLPADARRLMGLVTCDERSFYWRLTGRQNLRFFAALYGVPGNTTDDRIEFLFETLGLAHAADRIYQSYSSGMKQKMAIARGMLGNPSLVLYDEPTRSLDPLSAFNIRKWIAEENAKAPMQARILATNQLQEAEQLCDRVVILSGGQMIAQGTIEEIRQRWRQSEFVIHRVKCRHLPPGIRFLPDPERGLLGIEDLDSKAGTRELRVSAVPDSDALSSVMSRVLSAGGIITGCETDNASFDQIFCSMVSHEAEAHR
jgi:ABC-2 type transport system ATP-binding protein